MEPSPAFSINKINASEDISGFFTGENDSFKVPDTYDQLTPLERPQALKVVSRFHFWTGQNYIFYALGYV